MLAKLLGDVGKGQTVATPREGGFFGGIVSGRGGSDISRAMATGVYRWALPNRACIDQCIKPHIFCQNAPLTGSVSKTRAQHVCTWLL